MSEIKQILFYRVVDNEGLFGIGAGFIEDIIKQINEAEGDILFRINSPGGSVFDGWSLVQHIKEAKSKGKVNMIVDGLGASMGGAFLAYADHAQITQLGRIMIHKAYASYLDPQNPKHAEHIKLLQSINIDLKSAFKKSVEGRGKDSAFLDEIFKSDSPEDVTNGGKQYWFNAKEALNFGLVDAIAKDNALKLVAENHDLKDKYYELFQTNKNEVVEMNWTKIFGSKSKNVAEVELSAEETEAKEVIQTVINETKSEINNHVDEKINEILNAVNKITDSFSNFQNIVEENHTETVNQINSLNGRIEALETKNTALENALSLVTSEEDAPKIEPKAEGKKSIGQQEDELKTKIKAKAKSKINY